MGKASKRVWFNRIFSAAGLSIGGGILVWLVVYVARTMDVRALLASVRPLWLACAALCVPISESVDALILYGMGRTAGCPMALGAVSTRPISASSTTSWAPPEPPSSSS